MRHLCTVRVFFQIKPNSSPFFLLTVFAVAMVVDAKINEVGRWNGFEALFKGFLWCVVEVRVVRHDICGFFSFNPSLPCLHGEGKR